MDVLQTKKIQFAPVILYLPGHEHNRKQLYKDEPELWKAFRRLSTSKQSPQLQPQRLTYGHGLSPFSIPGKDGMKCMCYEQMMKIIKDQSCIQPPMTFRCSNGNPPVVPTDCIFPTWPKRAMMAFRHNEELQFPLGTIVVRWQQKRLLPRYNKAVLRVLLQKFGPVRDVRILGTNSCLVIFEDISSACNMMQARHLGELSNPLHCTWWHKSMANKTVAIRKKGVVVQTNLYLT